LVSLDFRKAFDTLEWPFIKSVLNLFNFGESVKRWTSIFYTDVESAVLNNGFPTNWFKPTRGVRQDCPLSPFLFILGAEILSNKIRQSKLVKGINIYGNEVKVSQFAGDTNLFCEDITSVDNALCLVNDFAPVSGLKLNVKRPRHFGWVNGAITERHRCNCHGHAILLKFWEYTSLTTTKTMITTIST